MTKNDRTSRKQLKTLDGAQLEKIQGGGVSTAGQAVPAIFSAISAGGIVVR